MARIRIGIDGYDLARPHGTGIATYGYVLGETIRAAGHALDGLFGIDVRGATETRETIFFDAIGRAKPTLTRARRRLQIAGDARRGLGRIEAVDVPLTGQVDKQAFADRLPAFDRLWSAPRLFETAHVHFRMTGRFLDVRVADPPAIMHWTYPVPLRLAGARNVYTLHDLVPLRMPYATLDEKRRYHALVKRCVATADHICTVSDASRADIRDRFPIEEARITTTWQASPIPADALDASADEDAGVIDGVFGLPRGGYFLFYGAIEPKKNVGRLIEAYLSIRTGTPLVMVSSRGWHAEEELRLIEGEGEPHAGRIVRIEHLPRRLLAKLIRGSRAVLFPSLCEGFGLPALEAMQLGAPLLVSNAASLPEVVGDAALQVDPYSVDAIAAGLRRLDTDGALRAALSERGPARAERFSAARYRDRLSAMYDAILAVPARAG